jgi:hypothetical protein
MKMKRVISAIVRSIGFALFCVSFFLPAVGLSGGGIGPDHAQGFLCALASLALLVAIPRALLIAAFSHGHDRPAILPYPFVNSLEVCGAGLVVPLVLTYLLLCISGSRGQVAKRRVALAILVGLACTWCFLQIPNSLPESDKMTPMIGHYLWTAGTLLIVAPELIPVSSGPPITR